MLRDEINSSSASSAILWEKLEGGLTRNVETTVIVATPGRDGHDLRDIGRAVRIALKPRMREVVTYDAGWEYRWWVCSGRGFKAFGRDQAEAYKSWVVGLKFFGV